MRAMRVCAEAHVDAYACVLGACVCVHTRTHDTHAGDPHAQCRCARLHCAYIPTYICVYTYIYIYTHLYMDIGVGADGERRRRRRTYDVESYLEGILWNVQMYIDGCVWLTTPS